MDEEVYTLFNKLKIPYEVITHKAIYKSSDRENLNVDFKGAVCCKNLFLKDKKNNNKYLVSLSINKKADLKLLQKELNSNRLTFASHDELFEYLRVKTGNASLLNITLNPDTNIVFCIDTELFNYEKVCFHPNVNTSSISFSPYEIEKILKNYDANYLFLDV